MFTQKTTDETQGNGFKLHQSRLRLAVRRNFFRERMVGFWDWLTEEMVESPFLEVFKM